MTSFGALEEGEFGASSLPELRLRAAILYNLDSMQLIETKSFDSAEPIGATVSTMALSISSYTRVTYFDSIGSLPTQMV